MEASRRDPRWSCADWKAWYDEMPGPEPDPNLYVAAECTFSSGSITWSLKPGNEGVVDDPELFVLDLEVSVPDGGTDDFVEETIHWSGDAGRGIKRVEIRGDAHEVIEVKPVS